MLLNILRGFTPQAALDAPRFCISAGIPDAESKSSGAAGDVNSEVYLEDGIPEGTVTALRGKTSPDFRSVLHKLTYPSQPWDMTPESFLDSAVG